MKLGQWFSPGTPVSSTNKTDRHDITEILLKVASNTMTLTITPLHSDIVESGVEHHTPYFSWNFSFIHRWFSPGTLAFSTTKTGRHDIAEILLKVALNTINQINLL
jgi:hypothetical protein